MNKENIKCDLIHAINAVSSEIYSLDEASQNQIFNEDIKPKNPTLLFLKNSYNCLNQLLMELNKL